MKVSLGQSALCALGAAFLLAIMGACIRSAASELPNTMLVFLRSAFGLIALLPWLSKQGSIKLRTREWGFHLSRSLAGLAAMYCFFFAIARMPLANAMLLNFSSPLFVGPLAWLLLRESLPGKVMWSLAIGFVGVALVLNPVQTPMDSSSAVGLLSGLLAALAMISLRRLARTEPALRTVFYFSAISTLLSAIPLGWCWQTPAPTTVIIMLLAGVCATQGQLLLTKAYSLAPAAQVSPFTYSTVVFAAAFDWVIWQHQPTALMLLGTLLVGLSGRLVLLQGPSSDSIPVSDPVRRSD